MAEFSYLATRRDGAKTSGVLEGNDRNEVLRKLSKQGLEPYSIERIDGEPGAEKPKRRPGRARREARKSASNAPVNLKQKDILLFTEELSDLLHAGLQLETALSSMSTRNEESAVKIVAARLRERLREGTRFSKAIQDVAPGFGDLYVSLVRAGELSGALSKILRRQVVHMKTIQELKSKVSMALIYPGFLVFSGLVVFVVFVTHLVPKLTEMILSTGETNLPPLVDYLIATSAFLRSWWWGVILFLVVSVLLFYQIVTSDRYRADWHRTMLRIPFIGDMLRANFYVLFLETMSNLLGNKMETLLSLELVSNSTQNLYLRSKLRGVVEEVREGVPLSKALRNTGEFPDVLSDLVRVGEKTGDMATAMSKAGERFDKDLGKKIERINALIQPLIIMVMAVGVGFMAYLMISIINETISAMRAR